MARIALRQLLDHAAERSYGVPAFNINNMEQGLAIMEAARACRRSRDPPGLAWRPLLCKRRHARQDDGSSGRDVSGHSALHPSGSRQQCRDLPHGDPARIHLGDDGRLARRRMPRHLPTYDYNVAITERGQPPSPIGSAPRSKASSVFLGSLETGHGEAEDGHGVRRRARSRSQLLTDPDEAARLRRARPASMHWPIAMRHVARRLQVHPQAGPATVLAMDVIETDSPAAAAGHASRHARLLLGAAGNAGRLQRAIGGRDAADLRRARRGDRARHPPSACARSTSTPTCRLATAAALSPASPTEHPRANSTRANS